MSELSQLSPQPLWDHFAQICRIPHPSYHEAQLAAHIVQWAQQRGLYTARDQAGNVLIRKPASKGHEGRKGVVLQAHLDMVPQKNSETEHDFTRDPIQPYIAGEWVKARGTTLGADNGIGLASVLAVLEDERVQHGPLEALLTMTEETGMEGALGLQPGWLQGELLINTDFEDEGQICLGCAGGVDVLSQLPVERQPLLAEYVPVRLALSGLRGGHSGCDIHLGRGNAIKLLVRLLAALRPLLDFQLLEVQGGSVRNAIAREAFATLAVSKDKWAELQQRTADFQAVLQHELAQAEPDLQLKYISPYQPTTSEALTSASRDRLLNWLLAMPNGVMRNSDALAGVVETSLNVGVLLLDEKTATVRSLVRSLIDSGKDQVVANLQAVDQLAGASTELQGGYPGWQPDNRSLLTRQAQECYQRLFGHAATLTVIHAGLECGLFKRPYPDMQMISIGPTITGAHSPDEQAHIASVDKYWWFLCELLKTIG